MMKNVFVLVLGLILPGLSFSQEINCLNKLLPYNRHSGLHQLSSEEWTQGRDTLDPEFVVTSVMFLVNSKLLCRSGELVIKVHPVCNKIIEDLGQSNTCFTYTNLGYFVISKDNNRNINFIFNRDRRFAE